MKAFKASVSKHKKILALLLVVGLMIPMLVFADRAVIGPNLILGSSLGNSREQADKSTNILGKSGSLGTSGPVVFAAPNDLTTVLEIQPNEIKTHDWDGTEVTTVTLVVTMETNDNIADGKIVIDMNDIHPAYTTPTLLYDKITNNTGEPLSPYSLVDVVEDVGTNLITIKLKDNASSGSREVVRLHFHFDYATYSGKLRPYPLVASPQATSYDGTEKLHTSNKVNLRGWDVNGYYPLIVDSGMTAPKEIPLSKNTKTIALPDLGIPRVEATETIVGTMVDTTKWSLDESHNNRHIVLYPEGTDIEIVSQNAQSDYQVDPQFVVAEGDFIAIYALPGTYSAVYTDISITDNKTVVSASIKVTFPPRPSDVEEITFTANHIMEVLYAGQITMSGRSHNFHHVIAEDDGASDIQYDPIKLHEKERSVWSDTIEASPPSSPGLESYLGGPMGATSMRNPGIVPVPGMKFVMQQEPTEHRDITGYLNYRYYRVHRYRDKTVAPDTPADFSGYKITFTIESATGGPTRTVVEEIPPVVDGGPNVVKTTIDVPLPTLGAGEFVRIIEAEPTGTDGNSLGSLPPRQSLQVEWAIKTWPNETYPNGDPMAYAPTSALMGGDRFIMFLTVYDLHTNQAGNQIKTSIDGVYANYRTGAVEGYTAFTNVDPDRFNKKPGDIFKTYVYSANRYGYASFSTADWIDPAWRFIMSEDMTIDASTVVLKINNAVVQADVTLLHTKSGYNIYEITSPLGSVIGRDVASNIAFNIKLSESIASGKQNIYVASTSRNPDKYVGAPYPHRREPVPNAAEIMGFADNEYWSYDERNHVISLTILENESIRSGSEIQSAYSNGWSTEKIVPAAFDESVSVKSKITNLGNAATRNLNIYSIIPYAGYLESSDNAKIVFEGVDVSSQPGAKVRYYNGPNPPPLLPIKGLDISAAPWSDTMDASTTAYYASFPNTLLEQGETLEMETKYKTPLATAGNQDIFTRYSFTYGTGSASSASSFRSAIQGFSTYTYGFEYVEDDDFPSEGDLPAEKHELFTANTGKMAVVPTSENPTRVGRKLKQWSTVPSGETGGKTFTPGQMVTFNKTDPTTQYTLYPVWERDPNYKITISYDKNDEKAVGTLPDSIGYVDETVNLPTINSATFYKKGYKFEGWYTEAALTTKFDFTKLLTATPQEFTLYAKWVVDPDKKVNVTFNPNGGGPKPSDQKIPAQSTITEPTDVKKLGYLVEDWLLDDEPWDFDDPMTPEHFDLPKFELVAKWKVDPDFKVKVKFDLDGGTIPVGSENNYVDQTRLVEDEVMKPQADPTKTGKIFGGWVISGTTTLWKFTEDGAPVPDQIVADHYDTLTLVATWDPNPGFFITVNYDSNGGTPANISSESLNPGVKAPKPADPVINGYKVIHWINSDTNEKWDFDKLLEISHAPTLNLKAIYDIDDTQKVTVTFDSMEGSPTPPQQKLIIEDSVVEPTNVERKGYILDGWQLDGEKWNFDTDAIESEHFDRIDFVLKAKWRVDPDFKITLKFDLNDGKMPAGKEELVKDRIVLVEDTVIKPAIDPIRFGYIFGGWKIQGANELWKFANDANPNEIIADYHETFTLQAVWTPNTDVKVTVTFDPKDGTIDPEHIKEQKVDIDDTVTKPSSDPTKSGYNFGGWIDKTTKEPWVFTDVVSEENYPKLELVAKWNISNDTIEVKFNPLGGTQDGTPTIDMVPQNLHVEDKALRPNPDPKLPGHKFEGWVINDGSANPTTKWNFNEAISFKNFDDVELLAVWEPDGSHILVTFNANGENATSNPTGAPVKVNNAVPKATATRPGYTFEEWTIDQGGTNPWDFDTILTPDLFKNMDLFAQWSVSNETTPVSFNANGGVQQSGSAITLDKQDRKAEQLVNEPSPGSINKKGYIFDYWARGTTKWNFATDKITSKDFYTGFELGAIWKYDPSQTIDVDYDLNGGSINGSNKNPNTEKIPYEKPVPNPGLPTRPGYEFTGWHPYVGDTPVGTSPWDFGKPFTQDNFNNFTLKAEWKVDPNQTVTFSFDANGGKGTAPDQKLSLGGAVKKPAGVSKFGYLVKTWTTPDGNVWDFSQTITDELYKDTLLTANWAIDPNTKVKVTFVSRGETIVEEQNLPVESLIKDPETPKRFGYLFDGWSTDMEGKNLWNFNTGKVPALEEGLVLYGNWHGDPSMSFAMIFNTMGGDVSIPTQYGPAGSLIKHPGHNATKKKHYDLVGWYTDTSFTKQWDFAVDVMPADPNGTALYALWRSDTEGSNKPDGGNLSKDGSGTGGSSNSISSFWKATDKLMEEKRNTSESWSIKHNSYDIPSKLKNSSSLVSAVPGALTDMPRYIFDTLTSHSRRKLEIKLSGGYEWNFSSDNLWSEPDYDIYKIDVKNNNNSTVNKLLGKGKNGHQFKLDHTGSWPTAPGLSVHVSDPALVGKTLYLYSYNADTQKLEYVSQTSDAENGWHYMMMPTNGGSRTGEYVLSDTLYKNTVILNPNTGGILVKDSISSGDLLPDIDSPVANQGDNTSTFVLAAIALLIVLTVSIIGWYWKKKDKNLVVD